MRNWLTLAVLTPLLTAPAAAPVSTEPTVIKVAGEIGPAVVDRDDLYALAGGDRLLRIDLRSRQVTTVVRFPRGQTLRLLAVAGGTAGVAATDGKDTHLHLIDLARGRITRTLDLAGGAGRCLGFASADLLYTVDGLSARIIEIATGKVRNTIKVGGGVLMDSFRVGDRLYIAREYAGGLAVVDLKEGKLLDLIPTRDWLFQVQVTGDVAFVWGSFNGVGRIDLKSRQYVKLKQPEVDNAHRHYTIRAGPDQTLLVMGQQAAIYQYDTQGRLVARTPLPTTAPRTLVGAWNGQAVLVSKDGVTLVALEKSR